MSPVAGRIRPKTRSAGIFSTYSMSPVSTSMFTRILVPKPKNAFQSPGVQSGGVFVVMQGSLGEFNNGPQRGSVLKLHTQHELVRPLVDRQPRVFEFRIDGAHLCVGSLDDVVQPEVRPLVRGLTRVALEFLI